jgi:phycobilisome rod-core linker protein
MAYKPGDINNFMELANSIQINTLKFTPVNLANIQIPDMTRDTNPLGVPVSINSSANFPLR